MSSHLAQVAEIDLYVDGADEITPDMTLLKGRGYDLVLEKLLAKAAKQFIVVADKSKLVDRIGTNYAIPIEVMPIGLESRQTQLRSGWRARRFTSERRQRWLVYQLAR